MGGPGLGTLPRKKTPHLDDIVRNHAQPHPPAHAVQTGIEATTQSVSSFEHTDPTLRTGSPLLPAKKPTLTLKKFPFAAFGFLVGHRADLGHRATNFGLEQRLAGSMGGRYCGDFCSSVEDISLQIERHSR